MNKNYRPLFYLTLCLALLFATTQVFASPSDLQGINAPKTQTPGAKATEKAIDKDAKQADKPAKGKHENFKGTVSAADANSITLTLRDGSSVTVSLVADTRIKFPGSKDSASTDIQPGMDAMVQAIRDQGGSLVARSVMVIPGKPTRVHRVGIVTAYSAGKSITVQDKDGNTSTFALGDDVKLLPADRADALAVGSRVTIIAPHNSATEELTATGIVIHPSKP